MNKIPQHLSLTNEHPTPIEVIEAVRGLLGEIDLDPASNIEANQRVKAKRIFTVEDDGLGQEWRGRIFLNPPGGIIRRVDGKWVPWKGGGGESSMGVWWNKLVDEWRAGRVERAVFIGFTLELLRISQHGGKPAQAFPRCYPKSRLRFGGDQPTHANVIVYLPARRDEYAGFGRWFSSFGVCEPGSVNHEIFRASDSKGPKDDRQPGLYKSVPDWLREEPG